MVGVCLPGPGDTGSSVRNDCVDRGGAVFLSVSRFVVSNDFDDAVRDAFRRRPHTVDDVPGFIRMEVANPSDTPKEFWLLTWWQDEDSFTAWHRSHAYHASHQGIPKGLRLEPSGTQMMRFEVFAT